MSDSDRSGPPERPRAALRPQQSAIRLRRPSITSRPRNGPSSAPPESSDVTFPRPTGPRTRAATTSVHDTRSTRGPAGAARPGSNQVREPSVLAPVADAESEESPTSSEGSPAPDDTRSEKSRKRGLLARLRWRSDTNLHTATEPGESIADRREQSFQDEHEYNDQIVNLLDAIDPEVTTLSSITNVQNSLYAPPLGRFINRRPAYNLTRLPQPPGASPPGVPQPGGAGQIDELDGASRASREHAVPDQETSVERIPSNLEDGFFAVRPQGISFADWSDEDLDELNDHVRHMLHSRQSAFHRRMKAFGQYVRRPLGFLITLYATLITLFGLAWVLFLIGWIYVGDEQLYVIHVIDNVLVALFAIVGDGMIPWRLVDTYHMAYITHYHRLTWKLRGKLEAPKLKDKNDLPSQTVQPNDPTQADLDLEAAVHNAEKEVSVLTPRQQSRLEHHQNRFAKSHTFYKPHETQTHHAFPLRFLVTIVLLLDLHSCLQLALGFSTWCTDYRTRPQALTATILSCSIAVNASAGIFIMVGDRKTRKKDVVERIFRQDLTREAMRRLQKKQEEKAQKEEKKIRRSMAADKGGSESEGRPSLSKLRRSLEKDGGSSEGRLSSSRLGRLSGHLSRHGSPLSSNIEKAERE